MAAAGEESNEETNGLTADPEEDNEAELEPVRMGDKRIDFGDVEEEEIEEKVEEEEEEEGDEEEREDLLFFLLEGEGVAVAGVSGGES